MGVSGEPTSSGAPARQVRAGFTDGTIVVYQAYSREIAEPALAAGKFVPPFKVGRMTWIKPSFLWMMYRSGWATKPGQERVLAVSITRAGFEWALAHSCLSSYEPGVHASEEEWTELEKTSPVRVQWDPERSLTLQPLARRAIQVGLSGEAVRGYVEEWTTEITDVTRLVHEVRDRVRSGEHERARDLLPHEQPYELSAELRRRVGASSHQSNAWSQSTACG